MKRLLVKGQWIDIPDGCTFLGSGRLGKGRPFLEFIDTESNGDFSVFEDEATTDSVKAAYLKCRERMLEVTV